MLILKKQDPPVIATPNESLTKVAFEGGNDGFH
jgi:hypothetical protein